MTDPIMREDDYEEPVGAEYCELAHDERHTVSWYAGGYCSWCQERQDD